ncbi:MULTISPECIES: response regulator transcription factor [Fusobacterium]|jgi:DNA-binding response OmpR family regulator|uniref:DNA-binding response regulator n=1 Tax=Fusobacterium varium ATCC 27725 TaxID=469618 RepID=A0ABN5JDD0_FUSVA|nr:MULTISPECIES: response regulator transcription factor [Fusobacterium]AVQ29895.1 DNA-binding response regulator [Fusobacterium varium ATCC 27725]EES65184.1 putative transcriptional regulatory protein ResD [Fusobacterium varium ATCC 27725]MCF0170631.1 response regulator transcription factor [Fusobacterium varium]MCF2672923.1 response regulator transcription factor [Fusobacterium varium]MCI6034007.1 response regulator transcription factor [Fusobacterium varium]
MKKILIVEDEMEIRNILKLYLLKEGYDVTEAEDGEVAIKLFYEKPFDLVILDIMLPKKDGWSVLREIKKYSSVPVMILSARDDDEDELFGFEIGTDEYITKPFNNKILLARIKTLIKNTSNNTDHIIELGKITINDTSHTVTVEGKEVILAPKEYELLIYLIKNHKIALSRDKMLTEVWGYDFPGSDRTIDTHIKNLRKKLGDECIKTVRGIGYKFEIKN